MEERDIYALVILHAMICKETASEAFNGLVKSAKNNKRTLEDERAVRAYRQADSMLLERNT